MGLDSKFLAHFPEEVSQELVDFVRDVVFYESRYVFIQTKNSMQRGFCSHCELEYRIDHPVKLKHNDSWVCPHCESPVTIKSAGRGRKNLYTDAYIVWYEKSKAKQDAIVALGLHVSKDYVDYRNAKTKFRTVALYTFEPGCSEMWAHQDWRDEWVKLKKIRSEGTGTMQNKMKFISYENVKEAVKGSPFQYSTWEKYTEVPDREDLVHFFDLASKYPCIEYLTKLGFHHCVDAKLRGLRTYGAINWNGKTLEKVIRLSKTELKRLNQELVGVAPSTLHAYQRLKKHGMAITFKEAYELGRGFYFEEALKLNEPLAYLTKYTLKQKAKALSSYYLADSVLRDLQDYWVQAEELGLDLAQDHIKYPNDLHKAHQETTRRIKIKVDKAVNGQIKKRLPSLERRNFSYSGLHIRPAASSVELFDEGKALKHCVGQYTERYAKGHTDIYVVRKDTDPDKPYFTVEIQNNRVVQCRGFDNCGMSNEVAAFIKAFESAKLSDHKKKLSA